MKCWDINRECYRAHLGLPTAQAEPPTKPQEPILPSHFKDRTN
jgi:hypothetical protein